LTKSITPQVDFLRRDSKIGEKLNVPWLLYPIIVYHIAVFAVDLRRLHTIRFLLYR